MSTKTNGKVRCKQCGVVLESKHVHDFVTCKCPNKTFVDGGAEYMRMGGADMSLIEVIGPDGLPVPEPAPPTELPAAHHEPSLVVEAWTVRKQYGKWVATRPRKLSVSALDHPIEMVEEYAMLHLTADDQACFVVLELPHGRCAIAVTPRVEFDVNDTETPESIEASAAPKWSL